MLLGTVHPRLGTFCYLCLFIYLMDMIVIILYCFIEKFSLLTLPGFLQVQNLHLTQEMEGSMPKLVKDYFCNYKNEKNKEGAHWYMYNCSIICKTDMYASMNEYIQFIKPKLRSLCINILWVHLHVILYLLRFLRLPLLDNYLSISCIETK